MADPKVKQAAEAALKLINDYAAVYGKAVDAVIKATKEGVLATDKIGAAQMSTLVYHLVQQNTQEPGKISAEEFTAAVEAYNKAAKEQGVPEITVPDAWLAEDKVKPEVLNAFKPLVSARFAVSDVYFKDPTKEPKEVEAAITFTDSGIEVMDTDRDAIFNTIRDELNKRFAGSEVKLPDVIEAGLEKGGTAILEAAGRTANGADKAQVANRAVYALDNYILAEQTYITKVWTLTESLDAAERNNAIVAIGVYLEASRAVTSFSELPDDAPKVFQDMEEAKAGSGLAALNGLLKPSRDAHKAEELAIEATSNDVVGNAHLALQRLVYSDKPVTAGQLREEVRNVALKDTTVAEDTTLDLHETNVQKRDLPTVATGFGAATPAPVQRDNDVLRFQALMFLQGENNVPLTSGTKDFNIDGYAGGPNSVTNGLLKKQRTLFTTEGEFHEPGITMNSSFKDINTVMTARIRAVLNDPESRRDFLENIGEIGLDGKISLAEKRLLNELKPELATLGITLTTDEQQNVATLKAVYDKAMAAKTPAAQTPNPIAPEVGEEPELRPLTADQAKALPALRDAAVAYHHAVIKLDELEGKLGAGKADAYEAALHAAEAGRAYTGNDADIKAALEHRMGAYNNAGEKLWNAAEATGLKGKERDDLFDALDKVPANNAAQLNAALLGAFDKADITLGANIGQLNITADILGGKAPGAIQLPLPQGPGKPPTGVRIDPFSGIPLPKDAQPVPLTIAGSTVAGTVITLATKGSADEKLIDRLNWSERYNNLERGIAVQEDNLFHAGIDAAHNALIDAGNQDTLLGRHIDNGGDDRDDAKHAYMVALAAVNGWKDISASTKVVDGTTIKLPTEDQIKQVVDMLVKDPEGVFGIEGAQSRSGADFTAGEIKLVDVNHIRQELERGSGRS